MQSAGEQREGQVDGFHSSWEKAFLSWVVFMYLYRFLDDSGMNSSCLGWVRSAAIRLAFLCSLPELVIILNWGLLAVLRQSAGQFSPAGPWWQKTMNVRTEMEKKQKWKTFQFGFSAIKFIIQKYIIGLSSFLILEWDPLDLNFKSFWSHLTILQKMFSQYW